MKRDKMPYPAAPAYGLASSQFIIIKFSFRVLLCFISSYRRWGNLRTRGSVLLCFIISTLGGFKDPRVSPFAAGNLFAYRQGRACKWNVVL